MLWSRTFEGMRAYDHHVVYNRQRPLCATHTPTRYNRSFHPHRKMALWQFSAEGPWIALPPTWVSARVLAVLRELQYFRNSIGQDRFSNSSSGGTDNILGGGGTLHETKLETFLLHLYTRSYNKNKVIGLCILYHIDLDL